MKLARQHVIETRSINGVGWDRTGSTSEHLGPVACCSKLFKLFSCFSFLHFFSSFNLFFSNFPVGFVRSAGVMALSQRGRIFVGLFGVLLALKSLDELNLLPSISQLNYQILSYPSVEDLKSYLLTPPRFQPVGLPSNQMSIQFCQS